MEILGYIAIIILFVLLLYYYIIKKNNPNIKTTNIYPKIYSKKNMMTDAEYLFYKKLCSLKEKYEVIPQVCLLSVIERKDYHKYNNELFHTVDYAIFTRDYNELLLLIELNDITHNQTKRHERDLKVRDICNKAGIKIITFYTNKPNEESYVVNRILDTINNK